MCDDHDEAADTSHGGGLRRRDVLAAGLLVPLGVILPAHAEASRAVARSAGVVRTALHVHSSFSEGAGVAKKLTGSAVFASMHSQVDTLVQLGADLCFFTDHDHIIALESGGMSPQSFRAVEDLRSPAWTYSTDRTGSPLSGGIAFGSTGLEATVTAGATRAAHLALADSSATNRDLRATVADLQVAVTLTPRSSTGWAEVWVRLSYHPSTGGRPAGEYAVQYRLTPGATARSVKQSGLVTTVVQPVHYGQEQRVVLDPVADLVAALPDLGVLAKDNGLLSLVLGVGAPANSSASAGFTRVELLRSSDPAGRLALQRSIADALRTRYPSMGIAQGLELSYGSHVNWFPPDPTALTVTPPVGGPGPDAYGAALVRAVAAAGGVSSYNHPFGTASGPTLTGAAYTTRLSAVAAALLANRAHRADLLEVGYEQRGGMTVAGHLALWDILLSAGVKVMANGVSDNHAGTADSWAKTNRYFTDVISATTDPTTVVPLLAAGRMFVSLRPGYDGMLDLASGGAVMGSRRTVKGATVDVVLTADALPSSGSLRVVQVPVHGDRTRTTPTAPLWERTVPAAQVTGGTLGVTVANTPSYLRTEVRDASGTIVAFSNPLHLTPPA